MMRKTSLLSATGAVIAAMMLSGIPAAHAQLKPETLTGSRIAVDPKAVEQKAAGIVRKNFARCVYARSAKPVTALLNNSDISAVSVEAAGIKNIVKELGLDDCLSREVGYNQNALGMKFSPIFFRDLMAEEAYLAANKNVPVLPQPVPPAPYKFVTTGNGLKVAMGLAEFADCVVVTDIANADALVRTMPASDDEKAIARAMAPALGECLTEGQQVSLTPATIRALTAYALWTRFGRTTSQ